MNIADPTQNALDQERLAHGFRRALQWHGMQGRKAGAGTIPTIPYISHLMAVSALVLEHGGTVDQAVAGLLHDAIEDRPDITHEALAAEFGEAVAQMVSDCSDSFGDPDRKPAWRQRKEAYVAALVKKVTQGRESALVSACDKLHNLGAIVADVAAHGVEYLDRFNSEPKDQLWYFDELVTAFVGAEEDVVPPRLKAQLEARLEDFRGQLARAALS